MKPVSVTVVKKTTCGFCATKNHENCTVGTKHQGRHEQHPNGVVWVCNCSCNEGRRKCADCGNRNTDEVSRETWTCIDTEACHAAVTTKRENNPFLAQLRDIKEKVTMAKIEENAEKADKAAKDKPKTYCLVTGEETKGGLFKPGMDARYVSERVIEVENAKFADKAVEKARARMAKDGVSDKLKAKFEKSLGLAKERADRKVAAAKEKEAAKAEKEAKAKAEATASV